MTLYAVEVECREGVIRVENPYPVLTAEVLCPVSGTGSTYLDFIRCLDLAPLLASGEGVPLPRGELFYGYQVGF